MLRTHLTALGLALALSAFGSAAQAQADVGGAAAPTSGADMSSDLAQTIAVGDELTAPVRNVTPSRLPSARRERQRFLEVNEARRAGGMAGPDFTALAQTALTA